ncbi:MAG: hypothetical protein V1799_02260 [bacterium]
MPTADQETQKRRLSLRKYTPNLITGIFTVLGIVIGFLLNQIFLPRTSVVSERSELRKEILKLQYPHLQKLKRIAEIGGFVYFQSFTRVYMSSNRTVLGEDKEGIKVKIAGVAADTTLRKEWFSLVQEIDKAKDVLDSDVYQLFATVRSFLNDHPFPKRVGREEFIKSPWASTETIGHWISLNEHLAQVRQL